jgi:cell division protein FtsB
MEASMTNKIARKTLPISQVLLILAGLLVLYMLLGFGRLIRVYQQQRQDLQQTEQKLLLAQQEQAQLEKMLRYAQSDAAAEEWARNNGLAKSGEVPVVVIAPSAGPSVPTNRNLEGANPGSPRDVWWDLFFGTR